MVLNNGIPVAGIATDASQSIKKGITLYRLIDLKNGHEICNINLGNQTVNIGEFLGIIASIKYIIENSYQPRIIYSDSLIAIGWVNNKKTGSKKYNSEIKKAEIYLRVFSDKINSIKIIHWNKKLWGEIPADFGNK